MCLAFQVLKPQIFLRLTSYLKLSDRVRLFRFYTPEQITQLAKDDQASWLIQLLNSIVGSKEFKALASAEREKVFRDVVKMVATLLSDPTVSEEIKCVKLASFFHLYGA
jgi:hypothetical protein